MTAEQAIPLSIPLDEETIRSLKAGDAVSLSGTLVTGRDQVHSWLYHEIMPGTITEADAEIIPQLNKILNGSGMYHCGPVMENRDGHWQCLAGGPTTSVREEPYQGAIIKEFGLRFILGKGGMGSKTLAALQECGAVYLHAVGGAAAVAAQAIISVKGVFKEEFGMPEAIWVIEVQDFPAIVTMDSHGTSLHSLIQETSDKQLQQLLKGE